MRPSDADLAHCHALLARGSRSFSFAARLLPVRLRDPVAALYAFCRVSDDLVDESPSPSEATDALHARLDAIYRGTPADDPVDRSLAWLASELALPRAPLDALLEGYLWDAEGRRYDDLSGVIAYSARVAASVGVAMTWLMGPRDRDVLARASDLGVAMQLTNIARDVGEDARRGRVYLPLDWLGLSPDALEAWLAAPRPTPEVRDATRRLLDHADVLYARAESGIPHLPSDVRLAIRAARRIYAEIGEVVRAHGHDSVTDRAFTTTLAKSRLAGLALADELAARTSSAASRGLSDAPLPEVVLLLPPAPTPPPAPSLAHP
jgi:phytoene synthase